ncbi:MAG TPA: hypothetical protein VFW23_01180 [Tepidisphaeraceae bacterium]|nr:hypothetical protein [Tepidisphaeraceae bacterium]
MALPQLISALHGQIELVLRRLSGLLNKAMQKHDCIILNTKDDP